MKPRNTIAGTTLVVLCIFTLCLRAAHAEDSLSPAGLRTPAGPSMTAVAKRAAARPGASIAVDVYLSNIEDLGAYQIGLTTSGGTSGHLTAEQVEIDRTRMGYVFAAVETVDMLDHKPRSARIAVSSNAGGAQVGAEPRYAGTFHFRASKNAMGTFLIDIGVSPASSIMTTSQGVAIPFAVGEPAEISITTPGHSVSQYE